MGRPRSNTCTVGWHASRPVIDALRSAALEQGTTPGLLLTRLLERELAKGSAALRLERPLSARELAQRIHYPQGL